MEDTKSKLEQVNKDIAALIKNKDELMAELAEKPKLRHGDYGYSGGHTILLSNNEGQLQATDSVDDLLSIRPVEKPAYTILGNIFDDLKAMAEPLKEFEISDMTGRITVEGNLKMQTDDNHRVYVYKKDIPAFILNLRRMEATIKRKQHGKEEA